MAIVGKTGYTKATLSSVHFNAGTIHKNLEYETNGTILTAVTNATASIVGATQGGCTLSITPEFTPIAVDGVKVAIRGSKVKTGEVATLKAKFIELTKDILISATNGQEGTSADTNFIKIESKADIEEGDYWDNIAVVGETAEGNYAIAVLKNALCISGLELGKEDKSASVPEIEFECHADKDSNGDTLPWEIYIAKPATN